MSFVMYGMLTVYSNEVSTSVAYLACQYFTFRRSVKSVCTYSHCLLIRQKLRMSLARLQWMWVTYSSKRKSCNQITACTAIKLCQSDLCVARNFSDITLIIIICLLVKPPSHYLVVRLLCCYTVIVFVAVQPDQFPCFCSFEIVTVYCCSGRTFEEHLCVKLFSFFFICFTVTGYSSFSKTLEFFRCCVELETTVLCFCAI